MIVSRLVRFFLISAAAAGMLLAASAKKPAPTPSPVAQKPAVRIDPSSVAEGGKSGLVATYADVLEPAQKAVVSVYSTKIIKERFTINPFLRQFFGNIPDQERESRQEGLGSGVIVTADGYVLTNNHVVEGADELKITLADDRDFIGKVIGRDPKTDVALLKIDGVDLPTVTLADSDKLRVGDVVFAVGNPLGVGQTVTMGIISAKGRSKLGLLDSVSGFEDFVQTDAAINMGNSGGALIDARGRLIGINSAIISPSRGNIGIGFAIPINLAAFIMNSLAQYGTVARGTLGAHGDTMTADVAEQLGLPKTSRGVVVTEIDPDSPAEKAGLDRADVILAINAHLIRSVEELRVVLSQIAPDSNVVIKIMRDGAERTLEATLGKVIERPNELFDGVEVAPLTAEARRRLGIRDQRITGLLITAVTKESAFREQLTPNMIILELNRSPVPDLTAARDKLVEGRNLLAIFDGRSVRYVVLNVTK